MIDPSMLGKGATAGQGKNPGALADFLSTCTNGGAATELMMFYCRGGGVDRGRGDAMMTWKMSLQRTVQTLKNRHCRLPPIFRMRNLSASARAAPELSGDDLSAGHGALANAAGSGGSAHSQTILPEHKQAVQKFLSGTINSNQSHVRIHYDLEAGRIAACRRAEFRKHWNSLTVFCWVAKSSRAHRHLEPWPYSV